MHPADSRAFTFGHGGVTKRNNCQPLGCACQTAKRVLFIARMLVHSGERARVQGLHEKGSHATDKSGKGTVHRPRCRTGSKESLVGPRTHLGDPLWRTVVGAGNDPAETRCRFFTRECEEINHGLTVPNKCETRTLNKVRVMNAISLDFLRCEIPILNVKFGVLQPFI